MRIKYKLLHKDAKCPTQSYEDAAAWDIYAITKEIIDDPHFGYIKYGTGLSFEIPSGYVGKIFPRSSISNTGMILCNSVGIIDPDYRGEITFRFKWIPGTLQYEIGDRIGQFRIEKTIPIMWINSDSLTPTDRGEGGYGSSNDQKP